MKRLIRGNSLSLAEFQEPARSPLLGRPRLDRSFAQGLCRVRNDEVHIDIDDPPKPATVLTGSERTVKREEIGDWIIVRELAVGAMIEIAKRLPFPLIVHPVKAELALAEMERLLQGVDDSFFCVCTKGETVDNDLESSLWRFCHLCQLTNVAFVQHSMKAGIDEPAPDFTPGKRWRHCHGEGEYES